MSEQYSVPTENEILKWLNDCAVATRNGEADHYWAFDVQTDDACDIVRAALEKWGKQQNIVPIPLSEGERLPGPEDCNELNLCWFWLPDINGHEDLGEWQLQDRGWATDPDTDYTHWQPFHAISRPS